MKYRIVEQLRADGSVRYAVQHKILFWWRTHRITVLGGFALATYKELSSAEWFLNNMIKKKLSRITTKQDVIEERVFG